VSRDAKPNDDKKSPSKDGEEKSPPAASKSSEQGKSEERPGASQKGNESPRDKPAANPGDQSTQKSDGEPKPVPGSDRGVAPGQSQPADGQRTGESGQQAKGESPDSRQGSPTPGSGPPKTPGQDRTPTGDTPEAKPESRPGGESKQDESSGRETTPNPSQTQGQGSPSPTSSSTPQESGPPADVPSSGSSKGQGLERLKRTLEEQASKQREQRQSAEDAERMRQAAQEMLKDMTPEQREKLREMARSGRTPPQGQDGGVPMDVPGARSAREQGVGREAGKQRGGGGEAFKADDPSTKQTETVDARGDRPERSQNSGERVIAEWYSDRPHTGGTARSAGDGLGETVRDAASGAQRAIEQQQVPGRHADLVRRVFRRYVERTSPGATQVAPAPREPGRAAMKGIHLAFLSGAREFGFDQPAWFWALVALAPITLIGLRWFVSMTRLRRWSAVIARLSLTALILALLAGAHGVRETDRLAVVGVLDISGSVRRFAQGPAGIDGKPRDAIEASRDFFLRAMQERGPDDLAGLVVFDGRALAVASPTRGGA
jgi:hypothetical protein